MAKVIMNSLPPELTPEEIAELEQAEKMPIVFDDDCPEMTSEMLDQFHRMNTVTIGISPSNMKKSRLSEQIIPKFSVIYSHGQ